MKHLIGILSNAYIANNEFGIDFEEYKKQGIDALDFQDLMSASKEPFLFRLPEHSFISYFQRLKKELDKYNLKVVQLHSFWDPEYEHSHPEEDVFVYYEKAVVAASILEAKYVVAHSVPVKGHYLWEKVDCALLMKTNKEFFNRLLPIAKKYNVSIALENLPFLEVKEYFSPSGTLEFVKEMSHPNLVMCLDTGHFNMFKENIYDFLLKGKGIVKCLHIHDNNGYTDSHSIPHLGTFDWEMFVKGLRDSGFDGVLSLETKIPTSGLSEKAYKHLNEGLITIVKDMRKKLDNE